MTSLIAGRPLVPGEAPLTKDSVNYAKWDPKIETDDRDKNTSDEWIPRHPELIRLTGRHPFNAEPPPKLVHDAGFMTPTSLHLVRNHGAVPKLEWSTHRIHIHGLVERPIELTMDELLQFPAVTVTCLITCCGNRRKEVNIVKKSQGFSWGPAAVSVNEWTGARLGDVLRHVGVKGPMDGAKWVNFRGPVGELPKGDDGSYGTGMTLAHAMDPANDVLIAYKQNGQFLHPDHGFPCRMLIPGWIGGRMVKWLSDITVAPEESTNWYHYHDNKVLPPFVDADLAAAEGWWKRPEFVLWDLNINSSIVYPGHDDTLLLDSNRPYTMQGYAYSGGGRKIQRVEVSFDNQKTWKLADLHMKEQPSVHGKYWCWVQWTLDVCTFDFLQAETVVCRAWDYGQNTQPAVLTWTLLGQGNNCMFMLKIHKEADEQGRLRLRFQQPAPMLPGELGNVGWREEEAAQEVAAAPPAPAKVVDAPVASAVKEYTMAEVEQHTSEESAWFVYEGSVYDGTTYLDDHPGGADSIILAAGTDATDEFNSIHSIAAKELLEKYKIGKLVEKKSVPNGVANGIANGNGVHIKADATGGDLVALNPRKKQAFKLMEKTKLSHNTYLFRFALQSKEHRLGLPVGKHMFLYANIGGETVMRAYTPSSSDDQLGYFDLVIKVYWKDEHPKFPLGGKMSQYMAQLEAGDTMDVKGPVGHFVYNGLGSYTINGKRHGQASVLSMIAGGTGITPMFQVIQHIVSRPEDKTRIRLLYANQTEDDILLREELEKWAAEHDNFELWYTLDRPPAGWKYSSGFINEDMIRDHLYAPGSDSLVLMCGPPPMLKYACVPNLTKVGHKDEAMVTF